jgi:hypothetical protein
MAFLQKEGSSRAGHQRTQRELSFGKDSHQQLPGQSSPFSFDTLGLRPYQLVQEILLARKVVLCYFANLAQGIVGSACQIDLFWTQKSTQIACWLCSSKALLSTSYQENRTIQIYIDLSKSYVTASSRTLKNKAFSPFFQVNEYLPKF